jgi:hypothetical protein
VPFEEVTPRPGAVAKGALGYGMQGNQMVRTYLVYWQDTAQFIREACGYPVRMTSNPSAPVPVWLHRELPIRDPQFPWLVAMRTADVTPHGQMLNSGESEWGPAAVYEYSKVSILFEAPDYDVIDDNVLTGAYGGDESRRYTNIRWEYGGNMVKLPAGEFVFVEGKAADSAPDIPQPTAMFSPVGRFVLRWFQLPELGIMNQNKQLNTNLRNAIGKVNLNDWPVAAAAGGYEAGTLLVENIKVTPSMAPIDPSLLGLLTFNPPRVYDIDIVMSYIKPRLGNAGTAHPAPTTQGHNTFMWGGDHLYYLAKSKDLNQTLYDYYDFNLIFTIQ